MEASEFLQIVEQLHSDAKDAGLYFQDASGEELRGRRVVLNGHECVSFGSCSYLGLELHPALIQGACDSARRYGTQFSSSRGYLSAPPYAELEATLERVFEAPVLVAASTTLGHLSAFDVIADERDAIVLDHQVHHSVMQAVNLTRARGTVVTVVKHEELSAAVEIVAALAKKHRRVWFCTDGVYSMYGDLAPVALLRQMLDAAPNVHLYIDDAHGMSWAGVHGRGSFLSRTPLTERMIVATSLNKAFAAAGGALVSGDRAELERIRMCGGTMTFSGPIQPPMLGAAIASARLHLTDELVALQHKLRDRVSFARKGLHAHGLPVLVDNEVPIIFIRLGLPRVAQRVAKAVLGDGLYVNVSMYPTVPMRRAGIRVSINASHSEEDVARLVDALARHIPAALEAEGMDRAQLDMLFAKTVVSHLGAEQTARLQRRRTETVAKTVGQPSRTDTEQSSVTESGERLVQVSTTTTTALGSLSVEHKRSIREVDRTLWDALLGTVGTCSWDSLVAIENLMTSQLLPEHAWDFDYVIVRDQKGEPVCATFFTTSLQKDDFLMRAKVSEAIEQRRKNDPYFLTSRVVMMGSAFSEGNHLYLRKCPEAEAALTLLLEAASRIFQRESADAVMLRDLPSNRGDLDRLFATQGYVKVPMLSTYRSAITFKSEAEFIASLPRSKRPFVAKLREQSSRYVRTVYGIGQERTEVDPALVQVLHDLYRNVARRKLRLNVFELPRDTIPRLLESPAWELVVLSRTNGTEMSRARPVAYYLAHKHSGHYAPFFCGLDYEFVRQDDSAYRQMLFQIFRRSMELGVEVLHLGMDAEVEKARFGAQPAACCVFLQAKDHYNAAVLQNVVAEVGMTGS